MAVKFQNNSPVTLVFPYGDFMEVNGQYGQQFLYTVEIEGQRDRLYATPKLHHQLQEVGIAPGDIITIAKNQGQGNRFNWIIQSNGGNGLLEEDTTSPASTSPQASSNSRSPAPDFSTMRELVTACLQASSAAWHGLEGESEFTSRDVRKLGISLFIECCRKGILPHDKEEESEEDIPF